MYISEVLNICMDVLYDQKFSKTKLGMQEMLRKKFKNKNIFKKVLTNASCCAIIYNVVRMNRSKR